MVPPPEDGERLLAPHALLRPGVGHPDGSDERFDRRAAVVRRRGNVHRDALRKGVGLGDRLAVVGKGDSLEGPSTVSAHGVFLLGVERPEVGEQACLGFSDGVDPGVLLLLTS